MDHGSLKDTMKLYVCQSCQLIKLSTSSIVNTMKINVNGKSTSFLRLELESMCYVVKQ